MTDHETAAVRLRASDWEDLGVIAAFLQDARAPLREMAYLSEKKRFCVAFTRYRRELADDPASCEGLTERPSALVIDGVERARWRDLDLEAAGELSLLTIALEPGEEHLISINLLFEGGGAIQLQVDDIAATLEDFGDARKAAAPPADHLAADRLAADHLSADLAADLETAPAAGDGGRDG